MKGHFKKIIAVLLVCAFAITGVAVIATDGLRTLENVKVGGIRIVIDNKEFTCTDASGAVVEPMIYNGTTYIPVRAVSTAFGKAVHWDGEESTVYLGNMNGTLKKPTATFDDLTNIAGKDYNFTSDKDVFDIRNNYYDNAYRTNSYVYEDCCEYLLDGKFNKFKATIFVEKGSKWSGTTNIKIIGDGKVLFDSDKREEGAITKTTDAFNIDVDIMGVDNFKILFSDGGKIRIAHEGFYQ